MPDFHSPILDSIQQKISIKDQIGIQIRNTYGCKDKSYGDQSDEVEVPLKFNPNGPIVLEEGILDDFGDELGVI